VKRRGPSAQGQNREPEARGGPASFTEEEVEALRHGKLDEAQVASILERHSQPAVAEAPRRPKKLAPVDLDEHTLREISEGSTPEVIQSAMEKAAKKDRERAATIDQRQNRPRKRLRR
jgi:hypothetical protein